MNAGRLHAAIYSLGREYRAQKLPDVLRALLAALQQSATQPTVDTAAAFRQQYASIQKILLDAPSNSAPEIRQRIFVEIDANDKFGAGLLSEISKILSANQATPAGALDELTKLTVKCEEYYQKISEFNELFGFFEIELDDLPSGAFEIGVSLNLGDGKDTLDKLKKETAALDKALKAFREVAGDGHGSFAIKSIGSSNWQLFIESLPQTAACLAIAIERIVALYKSHLEIRALKDQLRKKEMPEAVLKPIEEHLEQFIENKLKEISKDIIKDRYLTANGADASRANELEISLTSALKYITTRIDSGAIIEVRARPPKPGKIATETDPGSSTEELENIERLTALANQVNEKAESIKSINNNSGPVLALEKQEDEAI